MDTDEHGGIGEPNVRSRFVAMGFRRGVAKPGHYSATPPLEAVGLLSVAARHREGQVDLHGPQRCEQRVCLRTKSKTNVCGDSGGGHGERRPCALCQAECRSVRHTGRAVELGEQVLARAQEHGLQERPCQPICILAQGMGSGAGGQCGARSQCGKMLDDEMLDTCSSNSLCCVLVPDTTKSLPCLNTDMSNALE